jgi:protocatechuate 3,4-dioxygenase beta subunit
MRTRVALAATVAAFVPVGAHGAPSAARPCAGAPAQVEIAGPQEAGIPLRVRGRVLQPDGRTPAPGVTVYAYQTDASGLYAREECAVPRLRGFLTTDAEGRFEYRTVRPAPYPGGRVAAHVHHQLWGGGWPAQWSEDLLFADDPLLGPRERERSTQLGRFGGIKEPRRGPDGVLEVEIELRLKPRGDRFEAVIRHGIDACGVEPAP